MWIELHKGQTGRSADRAADQIRSGRQPQNRRGARPEPAAVAARPRRPGDRMSCDIRHVIYGVFYGVVRPARPSAVTRSMTLIGTLLACGLACGAAMAQTYPTRPVRIIVPVAAGSTIDLVPRLLAPSMSAALGQSVIIENRVGASGKIGTIAAVQSPPDGYTLATMTAGTHGLLPAISADLGYDPIKDLAPIMLVTATPLGFFVNAKLPVKSVTELADRFVPIREN